MPVKSSGQDPTAPLRAQIANLCATILPNAIGLSDAFGFTDWELDSALGTYDGSVYQELWKRTKLEPLNDQEVVDGYKVGGLFYNSLIQDVYDLQEYIKPMIERGRKQVSKQKSKL